MSTLRGILREYNLISPEKERTGHVDIHPSQRSIVIASTGTIPRIIQFPKTTYAHAQSSQQPHRSQGTNHLATRHTGKAQDGLAMETAVPGRNGQPPAAGNHLRLRNGTIGTVEPKTGAWTRISPSRPDAGDNANDAVAELVSRLSSVGMEDNHSTPVEKRAESDRVMKLSTTPAKPRASLDGPIDHKHVRHWEPLRPVLMLDNDEYSSEEDEDGDSEMKEA
ncbi:hypothetical protein PMZ80_005633 [Knufia obscura]|uniref:Uncharacterized protein n=1 Tax=Knufia obscura TaxID=1635080 RepID=A0ABR0RM60_9EURO|nr:hypothetical protein PMZ80_005633 [Knufia obscura]